jgi:hypothetical protein
MSSYLKITREKKVIVMLFVTIVVITLVECDTRKNHRVPSIVTSAKHE